MKPPFSWCFFFIGGTEVLLILLILEVGFCKKQIPARKFWAIFLFLQRPNGSKVLWFYISICFQRALFCKGFLTSTKNGASQIFLFCSFFFFGLTKKRKPLNDLSSCVETASGPFANLPIRRQVLTPDVVEENGFEGGVLSSWGPRLLVFLLRGAFSVLPEAT